MHAVIFVKRTEIGEIVTVLRFGGRHKNGGLDRRLLLSLQTKDEKDGPEYFPTSHQTKMMFVCSQIRLRE